MPSSVFGGNMLWTPSILKEEGNFAGGGQTQTYGSHIRVIRLSLPVYNCLISTPSETGKVLWKYRSVLLLTLWLPLCLSHTRMIKYTHSLKRGIILLRSAGVIRPHFFPSLRLSFPSSLPPFFCTYRQVLMSKFGKPGKKKWKLVK